MAINAIKCTMAFDDAGPGFTETHLYNSTNFATVLPLFVILFKARAKLCGPPVAPIRGRMSLLENKRVYQLLDNVSLGSIKVPTTDITIDGGGLAPRTADQVNASILANLQATQKHHRNLYLAGIPDALITFNPPSIPDHVSPSWYTDWQAYLSVLKSGWGYSGLLKPGEAGGPTVVSVVGGGNRTSDGLFSVILNNPGLAVAEGDLIQLSNYKMENAAFFSPNGTWTVNDVALDTPTGKMTIYLRNSEKVVYDNVFTLGRAQNVVRAFLPYDDGVLIKANTRKRGGRAFLQVGRRTHRVKI